MRAALFALWALFRLQRAEPCIVDLPVRFLPPTGFTLHPLLRPGRPVAPTTGRGPPTRFA